jgi:hypothetical protein
MMTKLLNYHQVCWFQFLSEFNLKIFHCPGTTVGNPDTLTCRSRDVPKARDTHSLRNQMTLIKPENILQLSGIAILTLASLILIQLLTNSYKDDLFPNKILKFLRDSVKQCRGISLIE